MYALALPIYTIHTHTHTQEGQPFPTGQEYTLREYYEMAHRVVRSKCVVAWRVAHCGWPALTAERSRFPQFAHDRVRNPTDDDVLRWARVPQSLAGVELPGAWRGVDP